MGNVFCFNGFNRFTWFNMGRITKNDRCLISFSFGNIFVNFYSNFTIFETVVPDNYCLQVLILLTPGTSLKVA